MNLSDEEPTEDRRIRELEERIQEINSNIIGFEDLVQKFFLDIGTNPLATKWSTDASAAELQNEAIRDYSRWMSESEPLIKKFSPENVDDFRTSAKRVFEFLNLEIDPASERATRLNYAQKVTSSYRFQRGLLESIPGRVKSQRLTDPKRITSQFAIDEIRRARNMHEDGHIRAAGVVGGVALEQHLIAMCKDSGIDYELDDSITALGQQLYEDGEVDDSDHRLIEWLASIRNTCAHFDEEREPDGGDVDRALGEIERLIDRY